MESPASFWRAIGEPFEKLRRHVAGAQTTVISARGLRDEARAVAEYYFGHTRPGLEGALGDELDELDSAFQNLLTLSERANRKATYEKHLKNIHKLSPKISGQLALNKGGRQSGVSVISAEDQRIAQTLEGLVPSAARSFKQALIDLSDGKRFSYRGPAVELREALRETLDHLAPDDEVMGVPGYANEKGREKPTMKQKVRFILKARGQKDETAPEQAASAVEEIVGGFARSVYEMSNAGTHGTRERAEVMRIRRYVIVVLHDILALPPE
jgi:hypothetical protein